MAELIDRTDRMGIERLVVFMGYPFVADTTPEELHRQNDQESLFPRIGEARANRSQHDGRRMADDTMIGNLSHTILHRPS
jgi:hypothetical protein